MRVTHILAAIVMMGALIFGVCKLLGLGRPSGTGNIIQEERKLSSSDVAASNSGPQPKVEVETEFDFGRMEVGEERSHAFTFRNVGVAPLIVENGGTTCQCTVSDMKKGEKREIPPGSSSSVTLTWKPEVQAEKFSKGADFFTNDPTRQKISVRAVGMVAPRAVVYPEKEWFLSEVTDEKPSHFTGAIVSPVIDQFKVIAVESSSDLLSFEVVPAPKAKLESHQGLCGYEIRVTVKPDMPLGAFRFPLTIKTDLPGRTAEGGLGKPIEFEILLSGMRRGPIQPAGREWIDDKMAISLGSFDAMQGQKVRLPLFVKNPPEGGLKLTAEPVCTPSEIRVEVEREDRADGKPPRYFLTVEYPAGSPRATHRAEDPARMRLQTNHPHGQNVEFLVFFAAY